MADRIITPEAVLSYPHLFEPQAAAEGQEPKFSAALVFLDGTDITPLKKGAVEAAKEKWGDKAAGLIKSGKLRMPFRDDAEEKGYPEGSVFINARSNQRPGVVSIYPDPNTGKPTPITDPEEIYPGCIVRGSITPFAYDVSGNKGVSFALNNLQKLRDGDRLDNRVKAEDEFEADEDAVADLDDLTDPVTEDETEEEEDLAALLK